jgi:hypothetical protein
LARRPSDSLATLVSNSQRFRNTATAADAYAEAWALNYYLLRRRSNEYLAYLRKLSERKPLMNESDEDRLATFQAAFGQNLETLDRDFVAYLRDVK